MSAEDGELRPGAPAGQRTRAQLAGRVGLALLLLLFVGGPLVDALHRMSDRPAQIDDAYISYRYAANWVDGQGLVWNPGERVEGFTNPLWTGLVAGALALGLEAEPFAWVLGSLSGIALLILSMWLCWQWLPAGQVLLVVLAAAPLAASTSLPYWSTSGLETSLHAALVMATLVCSARGATGWMTLFAVLTTYVRMDGILLAGVVYAFHVLPHWRDRRVWAAPATFAFFMGVGLVARFAYYGAILPNTYWAKVGGTPIAYGLDYVWNFAALGPGLLVFPAASALVLDRRTRPAGAFALIFTFYVVWVGGDAFWHDRFLLAVLATLSVLAASGLGLALQRGGWWAWSLAPFIPVCTAMQVYGNPYSGFILGLLPAWALWGAMLARPIPADRLGPLRIGAALLGLFGFMFPGGGVGGFLAALESGPRATQLETAWRHASYMEKLQRNRSDKMLETRPPELVASGAIGSFGYYSRLRIVDILGLTDPHIARSQVIDRERGLPVPGHARSDAEYVIGLRPEYIVIPRRGEGTDWIYALQDLWAHPDLDRLYVWDGPLQAYRLRPSEGGPALDSTGR